MHYAHNVRAPTHLAPRDNPMESQIPGYPGSRPLEEKAGWNEEGGGKGGGFVLSLLALARSTSLFIGLERQPHISLWSGKAGDALPAGKLRRMKNKTSSLSAILLVVFFPRICVFVCLCDVDGLLNFRVGFYEVVFFHLSVNVVVYITSWINNFFIT